MFSNRRLDLAIIIWKINRSKKKRLLVLKFGSLAFFIYQPKYLDLGKPELFEVFSSKLEAEK